MPRRIDDDVLPILHRFMYPTESLLHILDTSSLGYISYRDCPKCTDYCPKTKYLGVCLRHHRGEYPLLAYIRYEYEWIYQSWMIGEEYNRIFGIKNIKILEGNPISEREYLPKTK